MKGKTVRRNTNSFNTSICENRYAFIQATEILTLLVDVIFVNRTAFMTTSARKPKFVTIEYVLNHMAYHISKALNKLIKLYGQGVLVIHVILMYMEFKQVA